MSKRLTDVSTTDAEEADAVRKALKTITPLLADAMRALAAKVTKTSKERM